MQNCCTLIVGTCIPEGLPALYAIGTCCSSSHRSLLCRPILRCLKGCWAAVTGDICIITLFVLFSVFTLSCGVVELVHAEDFYRVCTRTPAVISLIWIAYNILPHVSLLGWALLHTTQRAEGAPRSLFARHLLRCVCEGAMVFSAVFVVAMLVFARFIAAHVDNGGTMEVWCGFFHVNANATTPHLWLSDHKGCQVFDATSAP